MSLESGSSTFKEKAEINPKPHCLFISGGMGTNAGIRGIKEGLEQQYGFGRVEAFNSVFNFKDPQKPKRFEQMADFIREHAKEGLDIVAHSLGTAELKKAVDIVKKRNKGFFEDKENTRNLHIVLVSPSGFSKGIIGPFRYLARTLRHFNQEVDMPLVSRSRTLLRGIHALTAFPPVGVPSKDLALALRRAIPELSQYAKDIPLDSLQGEQRYFDRLSDDQKDFVLDHSEMIRLAIEQRLDSDLRAFVVAYGEKLRKPLMRVFAGDFEPENTQIQKATRIARLSTMGGYIGMLDTLIKGFGSKTMEEIADLGKKGVRVDFLIPEYDVFMRLEEAIAFFGGSSQRIHLVEGVAHAFPALQATEFGRMVRDLRKGKVS